MSHRDLFSKQADLYAQYRPGYPPALYDFVLSLISARNTAWDCGTGNGQVSKVLAKHFGMVYATDISERQLGNAPKLPNVVYKICAAENTPLEPESMDLITVGQALHWFKHDAFYKEVKRVAKPNAVLVAWCYELCHITPEIDKVVNHYYAETVGEYWAKERHYIDAHYETIPFPFKKIKPPRLSIRLKYNMASLLGYLNSWSSTNKYIKQHGKNPLDGIVADLEAAWGNVGEERLVTWPIYMLAAKVHE